MTARALLYGATGFSGAALAERLRDLGRDLILAGRDAAAVAAMAARLGTDWRAFGLDDRAALDASLAGVAVVLHCAGPFVDTAAPMMAACLRTRTDYLDLAGEWPVFAAARDLGDLAQQAGVMLMPGVGFSVVASDCLLALAAARQPGTRALRLGVSRAHGMSRGSVKTLFAMNDHAVVAARDGALVRLPAGRTSHGFDFGGGEARAVGVSWPDVVTAPVTTGIATVETFAEADAAGHFAVRAGALAAPLTRHPRARAAVALAATAMLPARPRLEAAGFVLVAETTDRWRRTATLRMRTRDGYAVTTETASAIVRRILAGDRRDGFATPAGLFGGDFILGLGCAELDPAASERP